MKNKKDKAKYMREWRKKQGEKYREYKRNWAREKTKKLNALKPRCPKCKQVIKVIHS